MKGAQRSFFDRRRGCCPSELFDNLGRDARRNVADRFDLHNTVRPLKRLSGASAVEAGARNGGLTQVLFERPLRHHLPRQMAGKSKTQNRRFPRGRRGGARPHPLAALRCSLLFVQRSRPSRRISDPGSSISARYAGPFRSSATPVKRGVTAARGDQPKRSRPPL